MNSTFKVVFNKARGALMVVNEVTSSVQAKGTKTVVAAAVATMIAGVAGTAMAEEVAEPAAKITITVNDTNRSDIQKKDVFDGYTSGSDQYKSGAIYITDGRTTTFKDGVKFTNNTSEMSGGAIEVQAGTVTLKDAVITGNKADSWGGAIRMAGNSTVNLTVTKDTVYSGNKANANGKLDYPDMGDFVYMNGATNGQKTALNLKAEGDATLTVADSIASAGFNNEITTKGKVNVTGSMEAYTGDITVKNGSEFTLAGGFGSYDLWTDSNDRDYNSLSQSKLKVEEGGKASLGDLKITRAAIKGYDAGKKEPTGGLVYGTILDVDAGGELSVNSITVTSQKYSDKFTSYGKGQLTNNGTATVKDHITVEAGAEFAMTGDVTAGRIVTAAKTDKLAAGFIKHNEGTLTLNNGKSVNNGKVELKNVNIEDGASFETSLDTNQFTAQTVTVKEGGVFNVTKLNSRFDAKNDQNLAKDQLLIDNNLNLIFDHAQMHVDGKVYTGNLKVGRLSGSIGTVTLKGGEHNFTNLTVGSNGSAFNVEDGAVVTVGSLKLYQGDTSGAKVLVKDSTLVNKGALTIEKDTNAGQLELNNGTFQTAATDFFKKKEAAAAEAAAQPEYEATGNQTFLAGNGTLNLTSKAFEYSLTDLNAAQDLIDTDRNIKVVFTNGTLTLKDGETLDADSISGLNLAGHTGVAGDNGAFAVDKTTTVGAIDFKAVTNKEATEIALGNSAALTLAGNGGDVFKNLGAKVTKVTTGDLVLGTAGNSGNVNVDTLKTEALTVAGDFTARAVEATTAKIDGILTANSVKTTDATDGAKVTGALVLTGNVKKDVSELTGKVTVTDRGVLTTNRAAGLAYAAEYADEDLSVAYVDRQLKLAEGAVINIGEAPATGALAAAATTDRTVNVNANGIYGIDAASFLYTGKPAAEADLSVFGNSTALNLNGGEVEILNITKLGQIDLGGAITNTAKIDTDSIYVVVNDKGVDAATGVVTLSYNDGLVADKTVDARLKDAFTKGVGAKEMAILSALDTPAFFNDETGKFTADGNKALEQATGGNATAGVLNVAYDANAQVTDAIVRHQLSEHAGMGVWADVFYAKNEAKEIYGDFGYSADIYGGVLGFDYTAACGGTLGAALTVGTADADSEGGVLSTSLSSDFVGLSVYASKDFSGLNVKADLGYIDFSNDFTGLGDASDATTITFGVRGDFTAYQNGAFSVVPHMGLRYTRIDTDAVAFNDEQNMNVLEAPIGVKFAGTFEATGWKLVPSYDFTIVPQLGDKEVEAFGTAGDITILSGGLFNNVLGVEAVKDNMSFGLNASYGFGPDDRANTQVNANFRYHF